MVRIDIGTSGVDIDPRSLPDSLSSKPPPRGRTPIGDSGFYRTPDVIDPRDCANYPDSPWCGGNPISKKIIDIDIGVDIHACGVDIDVRGTLGFTKLPTHGVSYRRPGECRNEPPPPPPPDYSNIPKRSDKSTSSGFGGNKRGISDATNVYALIGVSSFGWDYFSDGCPTDNDPNVLIPDGGYTSGGTLRCPYLGETHKDFSGFTNETEIVVKYTLSNLFTNYIEVDCPTPWNPDGKANKYSGSSYEISQIEEKWNRRDAAGSYVDVSLVNFKVWRKRYVSNGAVERVINSPEDAPPPYETYTEGYFVASKIHLIFGRYGLIKSVFSQQFDLEPEDPNFKGAGQFYHRELMDVVDPNNCPDLNPYRRNPPSPPRPEKECCMQCCTPASSPNNNNLDLKEVLTILRRLDKNVGVFPTKVTIFDADENKEEAQAQVLDIASISQGIARIIEQQQKIAKIIGIDTFPLTVPASMIERVDNNVVDIVFDWFTPDEIKINNVMSFQVYVLKYLSGVLGHWQQKIHIEDTDAVKEGNQSKDIVLMDIATTLNNLTVLGTGNHKALGLITDVVVKIITEICNAKLDIAKTKLIVRDIQQFLDYTSRELSIDVPLSINIPDLKEINITGDESAEEKQRLEVEKKAQEALKNDLSKYLQPGYCKVVYEDWDGNKSLSDYFIHLATLISTARGAG